MIALAALAALECWNVGMLGTPPGLGSRLEKVVMYNNDDDVVGAQQIMR